MANRCGYYWAGAAKGCQVFHTILITLNHKFRRFLQTWHGRTDRRTHPLIEMRSRIQKNRYGKPINQSKLRTNQQALTWIRRPSHRIWNWPIFPSFLYFRCWTSSAEIFWLRRSYPNCHRPPAGVHHPICSFSLSTSLRRKWEDDDVKKWTDQSPTHARSITDAHPINHRRTPGAIIIVHGAISGRVKNAVSVRVNT